MDGLHKKAWVGTLNGASNSSIARQNGVTEKTIRRRLEQMHLCGIVFFKKELDKVTISEPIAYDGFETFSYSQYNPCHINHAAGEDSHFIYDFNYVPLNRKGRMTALQKEKVKQLKKQGKSYAGNLLELGSKRIFERLLAKSKGSLSLLIDEHKAYKRALRKILSKKTIHFSTVNSKEKRDVHNILFVVNCLDMQLRHFMKCFTRETIAFSKLAISTLRKAFLFYLHKNFCRPIFYKQKKGRIESKISPAMKIGLRKGIMSFASLFSFADRRTEWAPKDWLSCYGLTTS